MSGKFSTTSSSLFNNNNPGQLPDWMKNLDNVEVIKREAMDLGIEAKGVFAEKQTVHRDETVGTPRYLEASFNDNKLINDAKIQLAKFLSGKYYETDPKVAGKTVMMDVRIGSLAGSFKFSYNAESGKLVQAATFDVITDAGVAEYPFSKAGFEECVTDLKTNKVKVARKVLSGTPSMITLEEIVRRFNGSHREAIDTAHKLVQAGDIIGVGSNTFASMYSMDDLFPQLEKEASEPRMPEFHFAPNTEHVAANPHTAAKVLAIDASKTLAEFFSDFRIQSSTRDTAELLVKANVISDRGVLEDADFCFGIENDRVASLKFVEFRNERMTVEQMLTKMNIQSNVLDAYMRDNPTTAKRIYRGIVLTHKEIHRRLAKIVNRDSINSIIDNWSERNLITPVNSTTFTTTASFEDLLASVNTKVLTAAEAAAITKEQQSFGAGIDFDRQDVQDTGFRNDAEMESSEQIRLANLYNEVSKYFQNFELRNFDGKDAMLSFTTASGRQPVCKAEVTYEGNQVKSIIANRDWNNECQGNTKCDISKFAAACKDSKVLTAYIQNNPGKKFVAASVVSMPNLRRELAKIVKADKIDEVISELMERHELQSIGNDMYASKYPVAKLLNMNASASFHQLSEKDLKEINAAKAHFGSALEREDVKDTGVRDVEVNPTDESILTAANGFLAQHFSNFQASGYTIDGQNLNYTVSMFDSETGLRTNVNFLIGMDGNRVASCKVKAGKEIVSLANVKQAFATNEVLKKYLEVNQGKRVDAPMIMTTANLLNRLAAVSCISVDEVEAMIVQWEKMGKVTRIASNAFASKYTFEQLLSMSNLKPLSDAEFKERIAKAQREKLAKVSSAHIKDNDTRRPVDEWSADKLMVFAKTEFNKAYQQYEIIDVKLDNNKFEVHARATANGVRSKVEMSWKMEEGKPTKILSYTPARRNDTVAQFTDNNRVDNKVNKGLISKSQLKNKLASVMNINNFEQATNMLVQAGMIQAIDSNTFASKYSVAEIVERLAAFKQTNLEAAKDQRKLAARDEGAINMPTTVVMNTGSRVVEAQEKSLSPKMIELRTKMAVNIDKGYTGKVITARKHEQLKLALNAANSEKDLENIWKEFKKYLG